MNEAGSTDCRLDHPEMEALQDAFSTLPRRSAIEVRCAWTGRLQVAGLLETMGAFAVCIHPLPGFTDVHVHAWKGKEGACFDTGRRARYLGAARAVVDDDGHVLAGFQAVCEKTARLYALPPYRGLVDVTDGDQALIERLESDPAPFDGGTMEADAERLTGAPFDSVPCAAGERRTVLYPGPFRWIIARDGSLVRRGRVCVLPSTIASELERRDGLLAVPDAVAPSAFPAPSFSDEFSRRGIRMLMELENVDAVPAGTVSDVSESGPVGREPDWKAMRDAPEDLRERIRRLVRENEPYFVLSGSDPRDVLGCCPSTLVGAANRLVEAGILARHRVPAPAGACEASAYAFAGELQGAGGQPQFKPDRTFRGRVSACMESSGTRRRARIKNLVRAVLLALVALGFILAGRRAASPEPIPPMGFEESLALALEAGPQDGRLFVCVFRGSEACEACDNMARFSRKTVDAFFAEAVDEGRLAFREVHYDLVRHRAIRDRLGLAMNTVGLIRYSEGAPQQARLLTRRVWMLHGDEPAFLEMLRQEIQSLLPAPGEGQP